MAGNRYPPVGFQFKVSFLGRGLNSMMEDTFFQSVTGLSVDIETESIKEGGENRFEHVLPLRAKYTSLTLKRGIFKDSKLIEWSFNSFNNLEYQPVDLLVTLLNENHDPLIEWQVVHAWPKKWNVSEFNAEQSNVVIETMELNYNYFYLKK